MANPSSKDNKTSQKSVHAKNHIGRNTEASKLLLYLLEPFEVPSPKTANSSEDGKEEMNNLLQIIRMKYDCNIWTSLSKELQETKASEVEYQHKLEELQKQDQTTENSKDFLSQTHEPGLETKEQHHTNQADRTKTTQETDQQPK